MAGIFKDITNKIANFADKFSGDWVWCKFCNGNGRINKRNCPKCLGMGKILK